MRYQVLQGNNIDVLKQFPDNHFDSIVTDPPYGIDFLGKAWDANTGSLATYQECLRVLKPGGHLLAFSAARTYHHLAVTLEQAGFDIKDQIMWIYSSGFPKSQDIGKSIERINKKKNTNNASAIWEGWGTQLKPAHEPICLAQKPTKLSYAKNVQKWGVGALNIDACRIPHNDKLIGGIGNKSTHKNFSAENTNKEFVDVEIWTGDEAGRFPSNVLGEIPNYQKYFYCPKVSRAERHMGFDDTETNKEMCASIGVNYIPNATVLPGVGLVKDHGLKHEIQKIRGYASPGNNHPTVKPVELMKYLIQLVTPAGGRVLDPFNGSGSTGCAAVELGYDYTGIELDPNYVEIAIKRIEAWYEQTNPTNFKELFEC